MDVLQRIRELRILPVIKIDDAKDALPLAGALIAGGLPAAEVTFRTDAAEESIRSMTKAYPEMLVGAGSLTSAAQADAARRAGAVFFVSAGFSQPVCDYAAAAGIPYFPGICTPTELMLLVENNLPLAKFFPAEQMGGLATMKAIGAAFPKMQFMPTGGIKPDNIRTYLAWDRIAACGGSWMVKDSLIREGNFAEITRLTREAMELVKD